VGRLSEEQLRWRCAHAGQCQQLFESENDVKRFVIGWGERPYNSGIAKQSSLLLESH